MANGDKLYRKDFAEDGIFEIGPDYAKSLEVAIDANVKFAQSFAEIKRLALLQNDIEKQFKVSSGRRQFLEVKKKEQEVTEQISVALKEQDRTEKSLIKTIERKAIASESTNRKLIEERLEVQRLNKAIKEEAVLNSQTSRFLERITVLRARAARSVQDLTAKQALGIKLSDAEQKELRQSAIAFNRYDLAVKKARITTGQFQENVGNYPKLLRITLNSVRQLVPLLGAGLGFRAALDFAKEARQLSIQARGVEFAFQRIEDRSGEAEKALVRVREATRGALSDLDIKKSIVEFDNFGLSIEEIDGLLEFVTVRASQTGKSFENLRDSLVEGLSKESKLRIDNLGISTKELNSELEKTPNFVQAVANIAKREVAQAGNILDEAANSQQKWNADLENFKLLVGNGLVSEVSNSMYELGSNVLRLISPTRTLADEIRNEQVELNLLVNQITDVNTENVERENLIIRLKEQYPTFLQFLKDEKTDNESLVGALDEVNQLYITRIALQSQQDKIDKIFQKAGEANLDLARNQVRVERELAEINSTIFKNSLDLTNKSFKERIQLTSQALLENAKFGKNINGVAPALNEEAKAFRRLSTILNSRIFDQADLNKSNENLIEQQQLMTELEAALGTTLEDINEIFKTTKKDQIKSVEDLTDAQKKYLDLERQAAFNLTRFNKQQRIDDLDELSTYELESYDTRFAALEQKKDEELELNQFVLDEKVRHLKKGSNQYNFEVAQAKAKEKEINENFDKAIIDLSVERLKDEIAIETALREKGLQEALEAENRVFQETLGEYESQEKAVEEHEQRVADIKKKFAVAALEDQIRAIEALLKAEELSAKQRAEYEKELARIKKEISDIQADEQSGDAARREQQERDLAQRIEQVNLDLRNALVNLFQSIAQARIQSIDDEIAASDEKYEKILENENLTEDQRKELEEKREKERERLEEKKRQAQRRAAIFEKLLTGAQIGIDTAAAVMKNIAQLGFVLAQPINALTIALGAVQLGAVLATKIPQYAEGTDDHPGGWAVLAEERPEVVTEPGKAPYIVDRPSLMNLPAGTKVTPSVEEYQRLMRASILTSVDIDRQKLNDFEARTNFSFNDQRLLEKLDSVEKSIKKNQTNVVVNQRPPVDLNHELFKFKNTNWNG